LQFDLSSFSGGSTLALAGVILVAAVATKFAGCALPALRLGRTDAVRIGVGMVPRGEVGMVVAQIGLKMGVMAQGIYGVIVMMSVMTTLIAPPLLKAAFRGEAQVNAEEDVPRLG